MSKHISKHTSKHTSKHASKHTSKRASKHASKRTSKSKNFDRNFEELSSALHENYSEQRRLMAEVNDLLMVGGNGNRKKYVGFNKYEIVPTSLRKLLKNEEEKLPRSKVLNLLYQYFRENNMYHPNSKNEIIANRRIRKIFGMNDEDILTFYNLQRWLRKVYAENDVIDN